MDEVKDKMKGLIKKVNGPFSSSSGKFKGQGHVLGSAPAPSPAASSSSSSAAAAAAANAAASRLRPPSKPTAKPTQPPADRAALKPPNPDHLAGFDPFDPLLSTARRSVNGCSLAVFECPICARPFPSEDDVSAHIDGCLAEPQQQSEVAARVAAFVSGAGSVEVVLKLLGNVVREPGNDKFRRIRMGNPKIKEAVGDATGGVELLECVGFRLGEEGGEIWATMEVPSEEEIKLINEAVSLLQRSIPEGLKPPAAAGSVVVEAAARSVVVETAGGSVAAEAAMEPKKIDRKVRVFFSVSENIAAKIDLPDSFYNRSSEEIRREAEMRKKKMAESQLLIPKSYREKQAMAARKRYNSTMIRIQFPDGVVLQGIFLPHESTAMLYEFVSSALKESSLEFELLRPATSKSRLIPRFPKAGGKAATLEEEELVPSALIKFKPIETDSIVFTGLSNELLEASEPLTSTTVS